MTSISQFANEARLQAIQYRAWASAKRESNQNPRAPYRWPDHDIEEKDRRAAMFDEMAVALDFIAKHEDEFRAFIAARKAA